MAETMDYEGFTIYSVTVCSSTDRQLDIFNIDKLWGKYCEADGDSKYRLKHCTDSSGDILFFNRTENIGIFGIPNLKGASNNESYQAKLKSFGYLNEHMKY